MDWNNDGKKDLVLGEGDGHVRIYLNTGTNANPTLGSYNYVRVGTTSLDFGDYAMPEVADWNSDGKKDLLVGEVSGRIYLLLNTGTDANPAFGSATFLRIGSVDLNGGSYASPTIVDWDGDGKKDLLVANADGQVRFYPNRSASATASPSFDGFQLLQAGPSAVDVGWYARADAVDWDEDGMLDLLVGGESGQVSLFLGKAEAQGASVVSHTPSGVIGGELSTMRFIFDEPMAPASFSVADDVITFAGPGGIDLRGDILGSSWSNSDTVLELRFEAQSAPGLYSVTIGPAIDDSDAGFNAMDQDGDANNGEAEDAFTAQFEIARTAYYAGMDTNPGWTLNTGWGWGRPAGGGGDPTSGFTGTTVLGYNLGGAYTDSMTATRWATSPPIDCSMFTQVTLSFRRWLGVESNTYDHAYIEASRNGINWTRIWENGTETIQDQGWSLQTYSLSAVADRQPLVRIRFGLGPTDASVAFGGWNIDDLMIVGRALDTFTGTPGDDTVHVRMDPATQTQVEIFVNVPTSGAPTQRLPLRSLPSLTFNMGDGNDTLTVDSSNGIPLPPGGIAFNGGSGNDTLNVDGGEFTFPADARLGTENLAVNLLNGAAVQFDAAQHLAQLTIGAGCSAAVAPGGDCAIFTRGLAIADTGRLDLANNDLVVQANAETRTGIFAAISGLVGSARNGPTLWQGYGITSSTAAGNALTGLAACLNDCGNGQPILGRLAGEPVDSCCILVRYTWNGDVDLNGRVDAADYFLIDSGFLGGLNAYRNGDLNYGNSIDAEDYFLVDSAFLAQEAVTASRLSPVARSNARARPARFSVARPALAKEIRGLYC